jgi:hypothetical protein
LHPYWWSNWGFKALDEDLTFVVQEMGIEEEQIWLLNELKL